MTFDNAVSYELCDRCINEFEKAIDLGYTRTRDQVEDTAPIIKQDRQFFLECQTDNENCISIIHEIRSIIFANYYSQYKKKFGVLVTAPLHILEGFKIQKTEPGEGYHGWHCESSYPHVNRILAYTISLNDVDEGGETEFLYQHYRLKQKKGSLTFFPAGFTHTHRGNPPLSGTKYIMTGWITYVNIPQ
jgi:hypothetical protein